MGNGVIVFHRGVGLPAPCAIHMADGAGEVLRGERRVQQSLSSTTTHFFVITAQKSLLPSAKTFSITRHVGAEGHYGGPEGVFARHAGPRRFAQVST